MAGMVWPDDIRELCAEKVWAMVDSGHYCIDFWEGSESVYFLRPRHVGAMKRILDPSWGNDPCHFLLDGIGCALTFEQRPHGCRFLEAGKHGACKTHDGGIEGGKDAWIPYQHFFDAILE